MAEILGHDGHEVLTLGAGSGQEDPEDRRRISHRWKRIKYPLLKLFGSGPRTLRAMTRMMYGNWERHCENEWQRFGTSLLNGFEGSAVVMTRRGQELAGDFDPTIQAGDFDLYFRTLHRHRNEGDIKPMAGMAGVIHHHYGPLTLKSDSPHFLDSSNLRSLDEKWGPGLTGRYMATLM